MKTAVPHRAARRMVSDRSRPERSDATAAALPVLIILTLVGPMALPGCAGSDTARDGSSILNARATPGAEAQPAAPDPLRNRPPLLIDDRSVSWTELGPVLAELSGNTAADEVALNRAIERALRDEGISLTDEQVQAERDRLVLSIVNAAGRDADADQLLAELRSRRGLGPVRFGALLRRNAGLRALVRATPGAVQPITEERVRLAFDLAHGPSLDLRVIVTARDREAAEARAEILATPSAYRPSVAARLAADRSLDPSATRGGRLDRLSPRDPTAPRALLDAVADLEPNDVTGIIAVDRGFAVAVVAARRPPDGTPYERVAGTLRDELETSAERAAIDALARRLLERTRIVPVDASLDWSRP